MSRIVFLGPEGSYSHIAAQTFIENSKKNNSGNYELAAMGDFSKVIHSVDGNTAAIVPIENSLEGAVNAVLDILIFEVNCYITEELILNINHKLFAAAGAKSENIKKIVTHSQPYGQCRKYIDKKYPGIEIEFSDSTTKALEKIDGVTAAIAGGHIDRPGLIIIDALNDIGKNNTRFVVLRHKEETQIAANKITIVFESENKPGGLLSILGILAAHNLNMTKIESRPHKSALGRYLFIVDFSGNINDPKTQKALDEIKLKCNYYKYLGNYFSKI